MIEPDAGVACSASGKALGMLPGGIRRYFPGLDERLHTHQIVVHLTLWVSPDQRRHHMTQCPNHPVVPQFDVRRCAPVGIREEAYDARMLHE
jgi:hypothetical protein